MKPLGNGGKTIAPFRVLLASFFLLLDKPRDRRHPRFLTSYSVQLGDSLSW